MMTEKIYDITDLGPGDGGKGGVVHKVCSMTKPHTVIKFGGAQGSHGVATSRGERFAFSQWGCGTFEGIRTHLSPRMVITPIGILNEADALKYQHGIYNVFDLLTVDERALCATPYHGIASRLKEMARGHNPRGTIGTGVGEAYRDLQRYPELAIRPRDLSRPDLKERLDAVRKQIRLDLAPIIEMDYLPSDREAATEEIELLFEDDYLDHVVRRFRETAEKTTIVDPGFLGREILSQDGVAVVESSHGVLTDHFYGFHPHTSALETLPCFKHVMLKEAGYDRQIVNLGVTRAYAIRHGAGPLPTADPDMSDNLLPGSNKEENRYQGKVRVGPMDLVLLRYALQVCGGPSAFDGLAVTWFDQVTTNGVWHLCRRYLNADDPNFFTSSGEIKIYHGKADDQLGYQEALGKQLFRCEPEITSIEIPASASRDELFSLCAGVLQDELAVPLRLVGFGPTELDKVCK